MIKLSVVCKGFVRVGIHQDQVPIVFDYHHHSLLLNGLTEEQALRLACLTWENKSIKPVTHYSQSRSIEKNEPKTKPRAP